MKKMIFSALFAVAFLPLFSGSVPGKVTADRLNLRFAPELKSPVAGRVVKDTQLQVYGVKGQWLEVAAPETLKVYVSEAYIANGKTIASIRMYSDKSSTSTCLGVLPAGSEVKMIDDRGYGWVRIAPPEMIRLYTAKMYVEFDAAKLAAPETAPAAPPETAKEAVKEAAPATPAPETAVPAAPAADPKASPVAVPAPKEDVK